MTQAAGTPGRAALGVSATDMSPQMAEVVARSGPHAQHARIEVVRTPVRAAIVRRHAGDEQHAAGRSGAHAAAAWHAGPACGS